MFDTETVPIVLGNVFKIPLYYSLQIIEVIFGSVHVGIIPTHKFINQQRTCVEPANAKYCNDA